MIRDVIHQRDHIVVFFEVPNVLYTLRQHGIWDIIYEHCSYFSQYSLQTVFQFAGFDVIRISDAFNGQFLTIEARPGDEKIDKVTINPNGLHQLRGDVDRFHEDYLQKVESWRQTISDLAEHGENVVVWGAGSKGVTFLNVMDANGVIDHIVDINPRKNGMYVAGSGQEIIPPDVLKSVSPDVVIIMNPNYWEEIANTISQMGLKTDILVA
jgi:hypothetical protein